MVKKKMEHNGEFTGLPAPLLLEELCPLNSSLLKYLCDPDFQSLTFQFIKVRFVKLTCKPELRRGNVTECGGKPLSRVAL